MAAVAAREARNVKVVFLLVLCMSAGAILLVGLEPRSAGREPVRTRSLVAESSVRVESVEIHFASARDRFDELAFDCVIYPDAPVVFRPRSSAIRLLVVGGGGPRLADAQVRSLLSVLGDLNRVSGLPLNAISLHPDSDIRYSRRGLPDEARDLCALLVRKSFIR